MKKIKNIKIEGVLFIDIETAPIVKELEIDSPLFDSWKFSNGRETPDNEELVKLFSSKASLYPEFARVVCISIGMVSKGVFYTKTFNNSDEGVLIQDFYKSLDADSVKYLCGHFVKGFDIPFVTKRGIVNKIEPHEALDFSNSKPWELDHIICTKELWQGTSPNRSSLINVSTAFGYPSPKCDISGADVGKVYWSEGTKGVDRISKYCERDVIADAQVFCSMRCEDFEYKLTSLTEDLSLEESLPIDKTPLVLRLLEGGKFGAEEKKELKELYDKCSDKNQAKVILSALCSTAKGKKTKITKTWLKELK